MDISKMRASIALLIVLTFVVPCSSCAQVIINEVMAQNNSTITDPDYGKSADWVELYNSGPLDVDLSGYFITDNLNSPDKYILPQGTKICAGGYLLLWCDGNGTELHTSFKLSADGESVGLYSPSQELLDHVTFDLQLLDISYGRLESNPDEWVYYDAPTPGYENGDNGFTGKANQPKILTPGGPFSGSVTIAITNDLGGSVHYTLDGSEPTTSSPIYEAPLTFSTTTVLRARIIEDGKIPGDVITESYFVDDIFAGHQLPVVSIVTDSDNFWSESTGIYMQDFKPDWEVAVNIEMFLNNGSDRAAFNERAGIKINGLYAWQLPQKMLGVYFKKKYGESKLDYQLFIDDERSSFDNFALRASGSDWSYTLMRDGLVQQAARQGRMNLDLMAFRPCVVYVNGEFLGIHNIREKVDEDYVKKHYDLGDADFDMVEGGDTPEVGTTTAWDEFFSMATSTDLSNDENFAAVADEMDVENFTDYIITESYCSNTSLSHNTMVWKPLDGGKWRWILMDCDRSFFEFDDTKLSYVIKKTYWPLSQMLENETYKTYFCQRMADQLFTTFNANEICRQIDAHEADIAPLIEQHVDRWLGTTSSYGDAMPSVAYWHNEVEALRDFAHGRVAVLLADLTNYGTQKAALLSLSSSPEKACSMTFNNHALPRTTWSGLYPEQMNITLSATDRAGHVFRGWKLTTFKDLIERGSEWSYLDDGSDQGTDWCLPDYDDSEWKNGEAPLGYSFSDIKTKVSYGSSSSNKHITTYFRRHFSVDKSVDIKSVKLQLRREDAAAVYINGKRVVNSNLPVEDVGYKTKALQTMSSLSGTNFLVFDIDADDLLDGDNIIAVEVHQNSASSSDLAFDLQLQVETLEEDAPLLDTERTLSFQITGDTGVCAIYESTGENILPDSILSDMTLYKKFSPYLVSNDVVVGENARLTIEPGVTLQFSPGIGMTINGAMTADGTPEDSILFLLNPAYDASQSWGALNFINTADRVSTISYAELRGASRGPAEYNCVAAISGFKTTLHLDHLRITDIWANPVACRYSDLRLTNSVLHSEITGDMINVKYGKGYIADCEMIGNGCVDTDGIDYDGVTDGVIERVIIRDFVGGNSDAIDIGEQAMGVQIDNIMACNITDKGISIGQRSTAHVTNSTFIQTNLGFGVKDSCFVAADHCTFYAVNTPVACYEKVLGRAGGNADITACVFANSYGDDVVCDDKSAVNIKNSLSDSSPLPYGDGNTMTDPQFAAPALYDLSSSQLSDCGSEYMPWRPNVQPVITEICYKPNQGMGETEYIMLSNVGTEDIDLSGYSFTQAITFTFPDGVMLPAGESLYIVRDMDASNTNQNSLPWDSGRLADEGETIELSTPQGIIIDQVRYLPIAPWPVIGTEGTTAIVMKDPVKANNIAANWQLSQATAIHDPVPPGRQSGKAYDLQGREINPHSARGLIIINGYKIIMK